MATGWTIEMSRVQTAFEVVRDHIGRPGLFLMIALILWCGWIVIASLLSQYPFDVRSPYLVSTVGLFVGGVVGSFLRTRWLRGGGISFLVVLLGVTAVSLPIYANASAAVGGLFVALAGLATHDVRTKWQETPPNSSGTTNAKYRARWQAIVVALTLLIGVHLALGSQAAIVLTFPVLVTAVLAVWEQTGLSKRSLIIACVLLVVVAACVVVFLGSRNTWPGWLADSGSLSGARHTLWSDALSLWATQPLIGAGPGAFTPSSELASEVPSLASVHSLPLQVGSELGLVGIVLLGALLVGGLLFAARGSRPVALIATAAWTALAVHSTIDHLEDFPVVALMGGVILGWSGFRTRTSRAFRVL